MAVYFVTDTKEVLYPARRTLTILDAFHSLGDEGVLIIISVMPTCTLRLDLAAPLIVARRQPTLPHFTELIGVVVIFVFAVAAQVGFEVQHAIPKRNSRATSRALVSKEAPALF